MLTDKAKKFDSDTTSISPAHSSNELKATSSEKKSNNVLPLERPKYTTGKLKLADTPRISANESEPETATGTETVEIKSRIEAVLARMKSRAANADSPDAVAAETAESGPLSEELERRRAAIISIAREAEVHSREAAEKFRLAENKLKEEIELRQLAEQRVIQLEEQFRKSQEEFKQVEEESKQWFDTAQAEEAKRIEAEKAKAESEIRLKQESEARLLAEELRAEAGGKVETAGQALAEAKQAAREAEAKAHAAEEAARAAESLIYEADAIARKAEEKCQAVEANLQREAELRSLAEQMLKELAGVSPHLELNWENLEAALAKAVSAPAGEQAYVPVSTTSGDDLAALQQLQTQIEAEQKSRIAAEQARAEAEAKAQELETRLRKSEDKYRTTENGYKKVLRKQEEELRAMSEQVVRNNDSGQALATINPENDQIFLDIAEPSTTGAKIKLVSYGVFITLLVLALIWLGTAAFRQL